MISIHEAQKLLRQADYLASVGELERAAQKAEDAAMALRVVLRGEHDTAGVVRRVMRNESGGTARSDPVMAKIHTVLERMKPEDE